jgi:hypothetical protein
MVLFFKQKTAHVTQTVYLRIVTYKLTKNMTLCFAKVVSRVYQLKNFHKTF